MTVPADPRPWRVLIRGTRLHEWGRYPDRESAERTAKQLRRGGFDAIVRGPDDPPDASQ